MKCTKLSIPEVILFEPRIFEDDRGHFFESFNLVKFQESIGRQVTFVQSNESYSKQNVIRGLHYQVIRPQGKLVRVVEGEVFDIAVDLRKSSPTFGQWVGALLSDKNNHQLWIPEGFGHGFQVLSPSAKFQYMVTDYWYPEHDRCIRFNDPDINIKWKEGLISGQQVIEYKLSSKDISGNSLADAEVF
ncbi:dTDP-4-dehydrorhamnose 3,5-epimerase [Yersinia enterocolitica]|uniref:dTDP-4-dehydrorhamnose 3,5-epimerase n=1 Tax=Yersinia enterocolitica TaxID=630 RepID=UPI001C8E4CF3|nr:dTDP-4-dehydrorhamnose 3,5-epimerase [Yersinia enterocolitica]MBX9485895.1 dTDP-4-dehydrorhamnose 3,5-epimerase [Yersinia enterocolitica]MBX9491707.1 dTDP-4-dehydrorhamnose 3,5-epimerase [Yersinia enterocolitica]MBX9497378.1 dTDP-4-dehydrorhamnose 3,5-epimerase [Yersinia enterocolitica]